MAKGKHATALFEVIHSAKQNGGGRSGASSLLRTPKWWFKGRDRANSAATSSASSSASAPMSSAPAPVAPPPPAEMMPVFEPIASSSEPARSTGASPVNVAVDPDRQQITFRLTYNGAIIASFAVLVLIGLAYIVGRHGGGISSANAGVSTDAIRRGPIHSDVLNVAGMGASDASNPNIGNATDDAEGYSAPPAKPQTAAGAAHDNAAPASQTADGKGQRIIGMQYVIIQSYPDETDAKDACDVLKKAGIDATVEKLGSYSKWPCVVGTKGFDRIHGNAQYEKYIDEINDVSAKFAGRSKFKRFEPQAYRWR